jgi:hypothetical protein
VQVCIRKPGSRCGFAIDSDLRPIHCRDQGRVMARGNPTSSTRPEWATLHAEQARVYQKIEADLSVWPRSGQTAPALALASPGPGMDSPWSGLGRRTSETLINTLSSTQSPAFAGAQFRPVSHGFLGITIFTIQAGFRGSMTTFIVLSNRCGRRIDERMNLGCGSTAARSEELHRNNSSRTPVDESADIQSMSSQWHPERPV